MKKKQSKKRRYQRGTSKQYRYGNLTSNYPLSPKEISDFRALVESWEEKETAPSGGNR